MQAIYQVITVATKVRAKVIVYDTHGSPLS